MLFVYRAVVLVGVLGLLALNVCSAQERAQAIQKLEQTYNMVEKKIEGCHICVMKQIERVIK